MDSSACPSITCGPGLSRKASALVLTSHGPQPGPYPGPCCYPRAPSTQPLAHVQARPPHASGPSEPTSPVRPARPTRLLPSPAHPTIPLPPPRVSGWPPATRVARVRRRARRAATPTPQPPEEEGAAPGTWRRWRARANHRRAPPRARRGSRRSRSKAQATRARAYLGDLRRRRAGTTARRAAPA